MSKHGVSAREVIFTTDAKHDDQLSTSSLISTAVTTTTTTATTTTTTTNQVENGFRFRHPFTANITGPTGCGKTYFAKTLLQNCWTMMAPSPQRIVWLYKRWQPLYDVIRKTVFPRVEFRRGIPLDLDGDDFFDPRIQNVILSDDLMSIASKELRINDPFTEGSHHRNLTVIALNQNMYFGKNPTQRRIRYIDNPSRRSEDRCTHDGTTTFYRNLKKSRRNPTRTWSWI
jgi:hypothetical protein